MRYNISMSKINVMITNANGKLDNLISTIDEAVHNAETFAFEHLGIDWDIDVLVTDCLYDIIIPEDGVGGRAVSHDFIELSINTEQVTGDAISEMLVHELCHAARWGKNNEWANTLFDNLICEGLATSFEAQYVKDKGNRQFFLDTVLSRSEEDNQKIINQLQPLFDSTNYDYNQIFFSGSDQLPRWAGYSAGYYLVNKYLESTGKTIEDSFADKYSLFREH